MKSSQKAFTIVELLVVVAIIAILTAITTSNLVTSKSRARDTKRASDIAQLQFAFEFFFDRCNQYPALPSNLVVTDLTLIKNGCPTDVNLGTFLGKIPTPPSSGDYYYGKNDADSPTDYILSSKFENYNQVLEDNPTTAMYSATCSKISPFYYCVQPR